MPRLLYLRPSEMEGAIAPTLRIGQLAGLLASFADELKEQDDPRDGLPILLAECSSREAELSCLLSPACSIPHDE